MKQVLNSFGDFAFRPRNRSLTVASLKALRSRDRKGAFAGSGVSPDRSSTGMKRANQKGLTLVELIVAFTIMLVLSSMAVPLARSKVRSTRERELSMALREVRGAIDKYKDYADLGYLGPQKLGTNNWPETLDVLVEGVKLPGPDGKRMRFLRRIPMDPFTRKTEWGMRSLMAA